MKIRITKIEDVPNYNGRETHKIATLAIGPFYSDTGGGGVIHRRVYLDTLPEGVEVGDELPLTSPPSRAGRKVEIVRLDECAMSDGGDGRPLRVGVESGGYGVWLFAKDLGGKSLCEVKLDYFGNKLSAVIFDMRAAALEDEPSHNILLVSDVARALKTTADERHETASHGNRIPGE